MCVFFFLFFLAAAASPVKSPRTASLAASEGVATRERSASAGGQPGRPVKQVAATAVLEKPPAKVD